MYSANQDTRIVGCVRLRCQVDDIEEDLLIDATMMHYAEVQIKYDSQELVRKDKVVKGVARVTRGEYRARRLVLQQD